MANNENQKTLGVVLDTDVAEKVKARASSMGITTSKFLKIIITRWLKANKNMTVRER